MLKKTNYASGDHCQLILRGEMGVILIISYSGIVAHVPNRYSEVTRQQWKIKITDINHTESEKIIPIIRKRWEDADETITCGII